MSLAIDGTVHGNASTQDVVVNLTTTQANDYIIVCVAANAGPVISVSSSALGSLSKIGSGFVFSNEPCDIWAAFSSGVLSSEAITVHQTGAAFCTVDAFGVSGSGQKSLVFDSGGPQTAGTDPISITTVNQNTMVIAAYRELNTANATAGSGFTLLSGAGADFALVEYKVLTSAQTLSCTQTTGAGDANGGVVIAIVASSPIIFSVLNDRSTYPVNMIAY